MLFWMMPALPLPGACVNIIVNGDSVKVDDVLAES